MSFRMLEGKFGISLPDLGLPEPQREEARSNELQERFLLSGLAVLGELMTEVEQMALSNRFSPTRRTAENQLRGYVSTEELINPDVTEADSKRGQQLRDLRKIGEDLRSLSFSLALAVMDIEMSKKD